MKIAMIGLRGIPATSGGIETSIEYLAPELVKLGCDVTVYCRKHYCPGNAAKFKGVNLKYLPTINTKYTEAVVHTALSTLNSLTADYDIVHYHATGNAIFAGIPKLSGKKTIVTIQGLDWQREKWGFFARTFIKASELSTKFFPDRIISVSGKIKEYYRTMYNKEVVFIPNGVPIIKKHPLDSLKKKYGLEKGKYILFLSRIVPEKEVHTLINAFKSVKTDVKLVIAGASAHTDEYLKKAKFMAIGDKRIIFTGPLYGYEKYEAFSNCRFFVLPSTIEGLPIALLEAMSFECCPLVSDIEENLDVIENNGFSFKVKDEKALSKTLEYMIKHPKEVTEKGRKCKKLVKAKYDWNSIAKQTLQIYKEALYGKKH